jgi:hypothetical protein
MHSILKIGYKHIHENNCVPFRFGINAVAADMRME